MDCPVSSSGTRDALPEEGRLPLFLELVGQLLLLVVHESGNLLRGLILEVVGLLGDRLLALREQVLAFRLREFPSFLRQIAGFLLEIVHDSHALTPFGTRSASPNRRCNQLAYPRRPGEIGAAPEPKVCSSRPLA